MYVAHLLAVLDYLVKLIHFSKNKNYYIILSFVKKFICMPNLTIISIKLSKQAMKLIRGSMQKYNAKKFKT